MQYSKNAAGRLRNSHFQTRGHFRVSKLPKALGLSDLHERHNKTFSTIYYPLKINSFHDYSHLGKPCSLGSGEACSGHGLFLDPEVMETL